MSLDEEEDTNHALVPTEWRPLPPMLRGRIGAAGLSVNDHQFLVVGGRDSQGLAARSCEYYDRRTHQWRLLPCELLPAPIDGGPGMVAIGSMVYVVGAASRPCRLLGLEIGPLQDLGVLPEASRWQDLAYLPSPREGFACATDGRYLYVVGGKPTPTVFGIPPRRRERMETIEYYDPRTNQWNAMADQKVPGGPRWNCAAAVLRNRIYVVGGYDSENNPVASTVVFGIAEQRWIELGARISTPGPSSEPAWLRPTPGLSLVVAENRFLVALGGVLNSVEVLDTRDADLVWRPSLVPLRDERPDFVAGVLSGTTAAAAAAGSTSNSGSVLLVAGGRSEASTEGQGIVFDRSFFYPPPQPTSQSCGWVACALDGFDRICGSTNGMDTG